MLTMTDRPDADRGATLFARIPTPLDEAARRATYDEPLGMRLAAAGMKYSMRGFCLPPTLAHPAGVAVEIRLASVAECFAAIRYLAEVGAPPETIVEVETDTASMEMTLHEAAVR